MRHKLISLLMLFALLFTAPWKATASTIHDMGTITIYVDEQKTFYRGYIPNSYYVNANSWFLRQVTGSSWIDRQEFYDAKIVSSNSESCTIMGLSSNDDEYNFSTMELHCKGTRQSQGDYEEMVWTIVVKSYGLLEVKASPAGGSITSGSKVTLTAICNGSTVSGSDIYYTLDGSVPTKNSSKYTSAGIIINNSCRLKAKAYKTGYDCIYIGDWYYTVKTLVTGITLNATSVSLSTSGANSTKQLTATVSPSNTTDKSVTWSSSNTLVATVSNSGLVTSISPGTATITCKANDGSGVSATCTVTVVILVENISLNNSSVTLEESKTHQLTATVTPSNATDKSVTWSSSNTSVATVSSSGLVTAKSAGTAIITCKANDGSGKSASCKVTVESTPTNPDIYITSILSGNADLTSLTQKDKLSLTATFMNYGATATVSTRLWVFDKDMQTVVYSNTQTSTFYGNSLTTVSMDYALTDIPAGRYFASILYYDEWEMNTWLYTPKYLVEIDIVDSSPINKGDVNEDGKVNGTDLVALTNIILGKSAQKASADVNGDGKVNGTDYVALANIILGKSAASRSLDTDMAVNGTATLQVEPIAIKAGETRELTVSLTNPDDGLTLLQFDLLLPEGVYINKVGDEPDISMGSRTSEHSHQLATYADGQRVRCLLASPVNELIDGKEGAVMRMTVTASNDFNGSTLQLKNILGVTPTAEEVLMPPTIYALVGNDVTGVGHVNAVDAGTSVYNLSGHKVSQPQKGLNIINGKKRLLK
ncbi:MAG: Ig-like domain-containing protein [Prevotella sp.]|nr:Ig-like domain-containing protein [Prevotella sp.]